VTEQVEPLDPHDPSVSETPAFLLHAGRRIPVGPAGVAIGRGEESDVMLSSERASRQHARVYGDGEGGFWVADLGSRHGTSLNGERLHNDTRRLQSGDTISFDGEVVRFISGDGTRLASREVPITGTQIVHFDSRRLTIGRDPTNDVVLADPNVSRFHAEVVAKDGAIELMDLGSRNGTRLDGELVQRALVTAGAEIGIGPFGLIFDGASFVSRDDRGALRLDAEDVFVAARDKQILAETSLAIQPGEFVAIIGESGSGKSTLIKALAGVARPSGGRISVSGEPVSARLTDIGYVPQDDIVHAHLTVTEALRYAARLRLPQDTANEDIELAVTRVLDELALTEQASTRIGSLSGGQRKRTAVAAELLNHPSLLFLDEPTTGLDPGLESRMMALLRELANNSRAVTVVTHATKNLRLCDKVVVMGRGGELTFYGEPEAAPAFFGTDDFDGIYQALEDRPAIEWRREFESRSGSAVGAGSGDGLVAAVPAVRRPSRGRRMLPQARVLTRRYLQLLLRDRRNLALLIGQVPVLAIANVGLFQAGLFDRPGGSPGDAVQLLFLLSITSIWLGSIDAAREIVKEKSVVQREAAIGTRLSAYLVSKALVLFALVAVQTLLFAGIVMAFRPLDASAGTYAEVLALLVLTGFVAVGMGLLISAAVSTQDQAMSLNPLALIPQLLFAGAIVPADKMGEPVQTLSALMFAQWSFAGIGTSLGMNERIAEDPQFAMADRFGTDFFDVQEVICVLILLAFLLVFFASTALLLRRQMRP
jgi:ABC transport system ATP-binding/permease protein